MRSVNYFTVLMVMISFNLGFGYIAKYKPIKSELEDCIYTHRTTQKEPLSSNF